MRKLRTMLTWGEGQEPIEAVLILRRPDGGVKFASTIGDSDGVYELTIEVLDKLRPLPQPARLASLPPP